MDPLYDEKDLQEALRRVQEEAHDYLAKLQDLPANNEWPQDLLPLANEALPEDGQGILAVIDGLLQAGFTAATRSNGPRFFNFIVGGTTPAALAADWLVSVLDQNVVGRISSNYGVTLEETTIQWLVDLFDLPATWGGTLVTGATLANFTGLSCARQWWGEQLGYNLAEEGITQCPRLPVLSGGYVHPSVRKALQMMGHGRETIEVFSRNENGQIDLDAMARRLECLQGQPSIIVASAGEVNAGDFDPIHELAALANDFGAWLHVDAAFGLFARLSTKTAHLLNGLERANSIAADAHKWLNVPYESGFCLLQEPGWLLRAFDIHSAPYITGLARPDGGPAKVGPETSRRARAIPIWATLAAYGKAGYRMMVERHIALAHRFAGHIDAHPDFERLADVQLPIVCFRYTGTNGSSESWDSLNATLGEQLNTEGRFSIGTTTYNGHAALRIAIFNWRMTDREIDELFDALSEAAKCLAA